MKLCLSAVAGACILAASSAHALPVSGQISIGGYAAAIGSVGMAAATGIDFVSGANGSRNVGGVSTPGGITSFGTGSGSFAGFSCTSAGGSCGSIKDLLTFNAGPITTFLTLYNGATTVSFDLASVTVTSRDSVTNTIKLNATGVINETNFDSTAGTFTLVAEGNDITSFSAATLLTAVPEPATLAMLSGSLAVVGLFRRKKT